MLVLSPSVEAMKASAFSIPAATRASVSRPAPTVNCPPRSSQPLSNPTSSRAWDSGSSSRQETSCPSRSIARATEDPTRPQPTIRMNMGVSLVSQGWLGLWLGRRLGHRLRGRRKQDPAGRLLEHVLRRGADPRRLGGADPAEGCASPDPARRLAADHDRLRAVAPRRLDYAGADPPRS